VDGGLERAPWQVPNGSFVAVVCLGELPSTAGALQFTVAAFPPDPQFQNVLLIIDLLPVYTVPGPLQNASELVIGGQSPSLPENANLAKCFGTHLPFIRVQEPAVPAAEGQRMAAIRTENDHLAKAA
jgi:hypothetical protein